LNPAPTIPPPPYRTPTMSFLAYTKEKDCNRSRGPLSTCTPYYHSSSTNLLSQCWCDFFWALQWDCLQIDQPETREFELRFCTPSLPICGHNIASLPVETCNTVYRIPKKYQSFGTKMRNRILLDLFHLCIARWIYLLEKDRQLVMRASVAR
jgi:hypothetical protein